MNLSLGVLLATRSLRNMLVEMNSKGLELGRITKTACLLVMSGISPNSIPVAIVERCLREQRPDGGWVGIVDTIWNTLLLIRLNSENHATSISNGLGYLDRNTNNHGLWGRSNRDMSRIPVSGLLMFLLPSLVSRSRLELLEDLWLSEVNSLSYKAAYTLMAFRVSNYQPVHKSLIVDTVRWLAESQRHDGGYGPWKEHPVASDVFCTSIAALGLTRYPEYLPIQVTSKLKSWLLVNQLPSGIWPYHEIEDGASWGLYALAELNRIGR